MKKIYHYSFLILSLISFSAIAEVAYDKNNPEHKLDNYCVGVVSYARDLVFNDVLENIIFLCCVCQRLNLILVELA